MSKNLVIVESPAKSKTIKKYLGNHFEILASYGHVQDLEPKESSVDPDNHFKMKYTIIKRNKSHIDKIKLATKKADNIYLATDPDREGEAIAWHIYELLKSDQLLKNKKIHRIAFNEITKTAITHSIKNPRKISMSLVNAQQTRRILDFLVGFKLSPLLWKKVRRGLSAGRVQSPALKMIIEKETDIEVFKAQEYWDINAKIEKQKNISAKLIQFNHNKIKKFSFTNQKNAEIALKIIKHDTQNILYVSSIMETKKKRSPKPPFITSTLQQDAVNKLGFTTKKTMMVAQQLYEGIELDNKSLVGLITYMRTDSAHLAQAAINEIRIFIQKNYGDENLPKKAYIYKTKNPNAQEAHEAIRPTNFIRDPETIKHFLTTDQIKLYNLIWNRTIACQMVKSVINTITIELTSENKNHIFKITESVIKNPGFLSVYHDKSDKNSESSTKVISLSKIKYGEKILITNIATTQHFTESPKRYTEASLVKTLEEYGIGRPSTYANIISTLQQRKYVEIDKKHFKPTDIGRIVNNFLVDYFNKYIEYNFTSSLETKLDCIAEGKIDWIPILKEFWTPFIQKITEVEKSVKKSDVIHTIIDEKCPECKNKLSIRLGKNGRFIGCTNYPSCKYTKTIIPNDNLQSQKKTIVKIVENKKCPLCKAALYIRKGRYGNFISCSNYPNCKHIESIQKPKDTGVKCPKCNKNNFVEKKSRKGKTFYACAGFPKCKNLFLYPPINESCPKCLSPILLHKITKKNPENNSCPNENCDFFVNL